MSFYSFFCRVGIALWCILVLPFRTIGGIPYTSPFTPWADSLGNHRAVIQVDQPVPAVFVHIPWRRHGADPAKFRLLITDENGREMKNIFRIQINHETGDMVFEPRSGAGKYYVYYMPFRGKKNNGWFDGDYLPPETAPEADWTQTQHLSLPYSGHHPVAKVLEIQSRTPFDSFYPMEVCATAEETQQLIKQSKNSYLVFSEDRKFPIRMPDQLPYRWIETPHQQGFSGKAARNEYYAFQLAIYAAAADLEDVQIKYSGFSDQLKCFNSQGVHPDGTAFTKSINVAKGKVQPLWFGLDIPEHPTQHTYRFTITIQPKNKKAIVVPVNIAVGDTLLADRGDGQPWRHSRLRWLNSTLGDAPVVTSPYHPLERNGSRIISLLHQLEIGSDGFPASITALSGEQLLAKPMQLLLYTKEGIMPLRQEPIQWTTATPAALSWETREANNQVSLTTKATMEFDGHIVYHTTITALSDVTLTDVRLEIPFNKLQAPYFMGMGLSGQLIPEQYDWKWKGPQDSYWAGNYNIGLHCELQGAAYTGPLLNLYHPSPPPAWYNDNKGGFQLSSKATTTTATQYTGERTLHKNEHLQLDVAFLLTPVKQLSTADQFTNRYYHNAANPTPTLNDLAAGVKIINVHHANSINPYINYPFIATDTMKQFVDDWHRKGMKVKIYYTVRELSNQATELWALKSMGNEVLADGPGGGYPWLREHLVDHYNVQWFTAINGYEQCDAAILTSGESRWYNYYVEGLQWLVKNEGIDGLYLDDVSYGRDMLKRMRRVMDAVKPGCLLDLHSNTGFSNGPANQYTEFFPYLNKIWFGESFDYNHMSPANWLVEVSGIPFGLMGDMLQGGGNPWRGMVYGMALRYPWHTEGVICDPRELWKVWDKFGIASAHMIGYWDPTIPVNTGDSNILATVYVKPDKLLIALASWQEQSTKVKLQIDWTKLGWPVTDRLLQMPVIRNFQEARQYHSTDSINIIPGKGYLIEINK
nr:glycoside hydrolase domain-containing protein [Chitinophaga polysaccharea]